MIALGWTDDAKGLPADVTTSAVRGLHVLAQPCAKAETARGRLAAQVTLFEADVRFLPVPPGCRLSVAEAADTAQRNGDALFSSLRGLADRGQLTFNITWQAPPMSVPHASGGREWLRARQAHLANMQRSADMAKNVLDKLRRGFALPHSDIMMNKHMAAFHMLVPRSEAASVKSTICNWARDLHAPGVSLTVTGLWPPFVFVPDLSRQKGVAA